MSQRYANQYDRSKPVVVVGGELVGNCYCKINNIIYRLNEKRVPGDQCQRVYVAVLRKYFTVQEWELISGILR